jgi:hypothetical protein
MTFDNSRKYKFFNKQKEYNKMNTLKDKYIDNKLQSLLSSQSSIKKSIANNENTTNNKKRKREVIEETIDDLHSIPQEYEDSNLELSQATQTIEETPTGYYSDTTDNLDPSGKKMKLYLDIWNEVPKCPHCNEHTHDLVTCTEKYCDENQICIDCVSLLTKYGGPLYCKKCRPAKCDKCSCSLAMEPVRYYEELQKLTCGNCYYPECENCCKLIEDEDDDYFKCTYCMTWMCNSCYDTSEDGTCNCGNFVDGCEQCHVQKCHNGCGPKCINDRLSCDRCGRYDTCKTCCTICDVCSQVNCGRCLKCGCKLKLELYNHRSYFTDVDIITES